jgi:hypothetical protein
MSQTMLHGAPFLEDGASSNARSIFFFSDAMFKPAATHTHATGRLISKCVSRVYKPLMASQHSIVVSETRSGDDLHRTAGPSLR